MAFDEILAVRNPVTGQVALNLIGCPMDEVNRTLSVYYRLVGRDAWAEPHTEEMGLPEGAWFIMTPASEAAWNPGRLADWSAMNEIARRAFAAESTHDAEM